MAKKLSPAQQKIVDLMSDGWELGVSGPFDGRCWLQKGGVGRGGESMTVSSSTFSSMYQRGILKLKEESYPVSKYCLNV